VVQPLDRGDGEREAIPPAINVITHRSGIIGAIDAHGGRPAGGELRRLQQ
jgi:hypothetical protein